MIRMMNIRIAAILLLMLSPALHSCDTHRVFEELVVVEKTKLHKDSLLVFSVPIEDTVRAHDMYIALRHDGAYAYQNIIFFVDVISPLGLTLTDTLNYNLADDRGRWLVKRTAGLYNHYLPYRRNVRFPVSGEYTIRIRHGMRVDRLKSLHDVGVRIELFQ